MIFLIGPRHARGAHDSRAPLAWRGPMKVVFPRGQSGWIRGLLARNPCAIDIQPVHTLVDFRGLLPRAPRLRATALAQSDDAGGAQLGHLLGCHAENRREDAL